MNVSVTCDHTGPWTGRPCTLVAGHRGLHNSWGGDPIVGILAGDDDLADDTEATTDWRSFGDGDEPPVGTFVVLS